MSWDLEFRVSNQLEHLRADGIKDSSLAMPAAITVNACYTNHSLGKILTTSCTLDSSPPSLLSPGSSSAEALDAVLRRHANEALLFRV